MCDSNVQNSSSQRFLKLKKLTETYGDYFIDKDCAKRQELINKYNKPEWDSIIEYNYRAYKFGNQKYGFTKNSVKLSEKIESEIGYFIFPVVERYYAGRNQKSSGHWAWGMKGFIDNSFKEEIQIGSGYTLIKCLGKKVKLETMSVNFGMIEIFPE